MDDRQGLVQVRVSTERSRTPSILVVAIAGFLAVAVLKPWTFGQTGDAGTQPAPTITVDVAAPAQGPSAVPTSEIADPNAMACMSAETDQLVTVERWVGREIRTWVAVPDTIGAGPLDQQVPTISIFSNRVVGLGICGRRTPAVASGPATDSPGQDVAPGARILIVRSIPEGSSDTIAFGNGLPVPITVQRSEPDAAVLYGPPAGAKPDRSPGPSGSEPPAPAWPLGQYAIAFRFDSDGASVVRWLRIDLLRGPGQESEIEAP